MNLEPEPARTARAVGKAPGAPHAPTGLEWRQ